jgi:hypothetical protein
MTKEFYQSSSPVSIPPKKTDLQTAQNSYPAFFSPKQEEADKTSQQAKNYMSRVDNEPQMNPTPSLQLLSARGS